MKTEPAACLALTLLLCFTACSASWTILHTAAGFLHISWASAKIAAPPLLVLSLIAALALERPFAARYTANIPQAPSAPPAPPRAAAPLLSALFAYLSLLPSYRPRFCVAATVFAALALHRFRAGTRSDARTGASAAGTKAPSPAAPISPNLALAIFCALACLAMLFTLTAHRSDYDDSTYLQFAVQTMRHPDRPPLTYDISLGVMVEHFRTPFYRFSGFENFAALAAETTGLPLMSVYYLLLPALGSVLCLCAAYLLARWFLDSRGALLAAAIFLVILIAWGDTHHSLGNLALVRLYQGKCWLATVYTPFAALCGLMLLRRNDSPCRRHCGEAAQRLTRQSHACRAREIAAAPARPRNDATTTRSDSIPAVWLGYAACQVMAVGLSANGVVIACGLTLVLMPLAWSEGIGQGLRNTLLLGAGSAWPLCCGLLWQFKLKAPALGAGL